VPRHHKVRQGECVSSIASTYGFFPDTIWNHGDNADLKTLRGDPNVLLPGDIVFIPDVTPKDIDGSAGQRHRFRRKGIPKTLRIQIVGVDGPEAGLDYRIDIDGRLSDGRTDGDGYVIEPIEPDARRALLVLADGREYEIVLGALDPVDEVVGQQKRLRNLGFWDGPIDAARTDETAAALRAFQTSQALEPSGEADAATKARLVELNQG
jgi:N-acetylmuramoyl-L-alanine amidase